MPDCSSIRSTEQIKHCFHTINFFSIVWTLDALNPSRPGRCTLIFPRTSIYDPVNGYSDHDPTQFICLTKWKLSSSRETRPNLIALGFLRFSRAFVSLCMLILPRLSYRFHCHVHVPQASKVMFLMGWQTRGFHFTKVFDRFPSTFKECKSNLAFSTSVRRKLSLYEALSMEWPWILFEWVHITKFTENCLLNGSEMVFASLTMRKFNLDRRLIIKTLKTTWGTSLKLAKEVVILRSIQRYRCSAHVWRTALW